MTMPMQLMRSGFNPPATSAQLGASSGVSSRRLAAAGVWPRVAAGSFRRVALCTLAVSLLVLGVALPSLANTDCTSMAVARIAVEPDETVLTALPGNVHPLARAEFDRGPVEDSLPMQHIIMLLRRTPDQEIAMQTRIDQMHNHRSPLFHQWLSPERVGACYGVTNEDIAVVSQWLQKHGFKIDAVPAGKMFLVFSGTAGQVREAFHTEIHNLDVKGEKHIANMGAPQIPAALAPVIAGFLSLHNFFPKPTMHVVGVVKRDPKTGKLGVVEQAGNPRSLSKAPAGMMLSPLVTYGSADEFVGPADFYTIYNENSLLTGTSCGGSACNGAGQTIAVIEETDVCNGQTGTSPNNCNGANDLTAFESQFGLPSTSVNYMFGIPAGSYCGDPGVQGPDTTYEETEADVDLQWATVVAPGATVDFIACASTVTSGGVDLSAMYAINDLAATVSSLSVTYADCEAGLSSTDYPNGSNSFYNSLWEQAVAQGQTVVVGSGDSGDDTCNHGATAALVGWNVNGLASTPFDVAVGGTDFSDNYSSGFTVVPNSYWNTNDTPPYESALSYIPETTWNSRCGSTLLASYLGFTPEQVCNGDSPSGFEFTTVDLSSGGGISKIYSLPTWQSVYGVGSASNFTSSSMRNLPDVSLFAGTGLWNHALMFCESDLETGTGGGTPCTYSDASEGGDMAAGGTSFTAPEVNGLMAVINQRWPSGSPTQPTGQGQANYTLYGMANYEYGTAVSENTSTSAPSVYTCESNADAISAYSSVFPSCVFLNINRTPVAGNSDATDCAGSDNTSCLQDGNVMPCVTHDTDCVTATAGDSYGLLSISAFGFQPAWYSSAGYNDAVGLGSVNIANLVNNWTSSTWITPFTSTTTVTATPGTVTSPSSSTTLVATVTATGRGGVAPPMGTVSFYNTTSAGTCSGGGSLLGASALVPASSCTTSCNATATLMPTGSEIGGAGDGPQTITACFSGDGANDAASNGTTLVTVDAALVAQTITFNPIANQVQGTQLNLVASASSQLTVSFASLTMGVCTVLGTVATLSNPGTCTIQASQAGNGTYAEASPVSQSFTVLTTQTITFNPVANQAQGTQLNLVASASSQLTVSFASLTMGVCTVLGTVATLSNPGTCTIQASQAGNGTYAEASPVSQSFTVLATQTITFKPIANQVQGTLLKLAATASSGLTVSFASLTTGVCTVSGTVATLSNPGPCTIQATQAGNGTYAPAPPVSQTFTVSPAFTITPHPSSETVYPGVIGGVILTLQSAKGFDAVVKLSCGGGPAGFVCVDLPMSVKLDGTATVVSGVLFAKATPAGKYTITFTGTSGSIQDSATVQFTVK